MSLSVLTQTILTFTAIVGVGALLRASGRLGPEDARPLNAVIIYVGLPAFVFTAVHRAPIGVQHLRVVAVAWIVFAAVFSLSYVMQRLLRLEPKRAGAFLLVSSLGNTGYIGYPLTLAVLGSTALPAAIFYDVFGTVMALLAVGLAAARRFGASDAPRANLLREIATFPAVVAVIAGLALRPVALPEAVSDGLGLCASLVAPLIMISVGLSLRPRALAAGTAALLSVVVIRLVVAPAFAIGAGSLVLEQEQLLRVAVLEAGMPTMMLTLVIGERYGLDTDFIASAIFVTTAASAVSVPLLQLLIG